MLKTHKRHRTIQNHAIREIMDLVKGKVSTFFLPWWKHVFFPLREHTWQSRNIALIKFYGIYFKALS